VTFETIREKLRALYLGDSALASRFRLSLLVFDLVTITFFVVTTAFPLGGYHLGLDFLIAAVIAGDLAARCIIAPRPWRSLLSPFSLVDLLVVFSLLAPLLFDNLVFLRILRALRLLRSYHFLRELRRNYRWFREKEEFLKSAVNLLVFVFFISSIVFVLEGRKNPGITNFLDALYYTVTSLTTTGYGDITLYDTTGRLLTIVIMVVGVALFLRLAQTLFRPNKVAHTCPECGLTRHDPDAVHCKHCGTVIKIETEGGD
jgi:voltage-gated potassium channel